MYTALSLLRTGLSEKVGNLANRRGAAKKQRPRRQRWSSSIRINSFVAKFVMQSVVFVTEAAAAAFLVVFIVYGRLLVFERLELKPPLPLLSLRSTIQFT